MPPLFNASGIIDFSDGATEEDKSVELDESRAKITTMLSNLEEFQYNQAEKKAKQDIEDFSEEINKPPEVPKVPELPETSPQVIIAGDDYDEDEEIVDVTPTSPEIKPLVTRYQNNQAKEEDYVYDVASQYIKDHELFRAEAYFATDYEESEGIVTAGYGSTNIVYPEITADTIFTEEQATEYLNKSIAQVTEEVNALDAEIEGGLNMNQKAALTSLLYNIDPKSDDWTTSRAREHLIAGEFDQFEEEAFSEEKGYVHQNKIALPGLVRRRANERRLWQADLGSEIEFDEGESITKIKPVF